MKRKPKRTKSGKFRADGRKNKRTRNPSARTSVARSSNPTRRAANGPRRSANPARRSANPSRRRSNPTPNPSRRRRRRNPDMGPAGKVLVAGLIGAVALVGATMAATYGESRGIQPPVIAGGVAVLAGGTAYALRHRAPTAATAIAAGGLGVAGLMGYRLLTAPKQEPKPGPAFQGGGSLSGLHAQSLRAVEQVVGAYGYPEIDRAPFASSESLGLYS